MGSSEFLLESLHLIVLLKKNLLRLFPVLLFKLQEIMIIILFIASKQSSPVPCRVYIYTQTYTCIYMYEDIQILFFGLPTKI